MMERSVEPTVSELRARADMDRIRLTETVEALRTQATATANDLTERLSPSAMKEEAVGYLRNSRDQLWNTIETRARANPMEAVAVGAAVAYPALQLLRAVPAPLMLIGAGILFARASGSSSPVSHESKSRDTGHQSGPVEQATDAARRIMNDTVDAVSNTFEDSQKQLSEVATGIRDKVGVAADKVTTNADGAMQEIKSRSSEALGHARQKATTAWEQNPLLIAGIAMTVGAIIAAALPATAMEKASLGSASDAIRRGTSGAAHKALDVVEDAVAKASDAADEHGISVDGVDALAESLAGKVRAVADKGLAAAASS